MEKRISKEVSEEMSRRAKNSWRKRRGIKLVMTVVPFGDGTQKKRATCLFEGKTYVGLGMTHYEALNVCLEKIKKEANID